MSIREYSMTRDSTRQLSPSFRVREFACKGSDVVLIDDELVVLLQCIREHFGKPVHITSGYRTAAHNAAVGGAPDSQHLRGEAADLHISNMEVGRKVFDFIRLHTDFDQLLFERRIKGGYWWLHVSFTTRRPNRHQAMLDWR